MFWRLLMGLAMILAVGPPLGRMLASDQGPSGPLPTGGAASLDPEEMAALFDALIPQQLDQYHVPGAAIAVVQDGEVIFARGYGLADVAQERPVDAETTLFRTGSIAKTFTWTAVMQLVEQGKLDLNADVNDYLSGFRIPDTFPEPITLEHLMTHTAGFEDGPIGMVRPRLGDLEPLGAFLAQKVPARIFPPGQVTAYSNYGTALAGYIVELVSGMPFEQYVERNILTPLGMDHTTFQQPVPPALAADLATGYVYANGAFQPQPFELFQIAPAGSTSATVTDMGRFLIVHLQDGRYGDVRILEEQTAQLMHRRHFGNDPRLSGMAYGFYQLRVNGRVLLTHSGETSYFLSQLCLLPEENLGLYVVYNAPGGGPARRELIQAFFDRFYPAADTTVPQPSDGAFQRAAPLAGRYISTRRAETTLEKIRLLYQPAFQPITVRATEDGYLETIHPLARSQDPASYQPSLWVETEPGLYRRTDGNDWMVFREDGGGRTMMSLDSAAPRGYQRLTGYEALLFQPLLPLALVVLILGVMVYALFDKQALPAARWLAVGTGGMVLAFLLGLVAFAFVGFLSYIQGQVSLLWWAVFALPAALVVLAAALAVSTLLRWPEAGIARHVPYALAVVAAGGLLLWANFWNLIGWKF